MNTLPIVSIVGRPNVGKSSIFNRVLKKRVAIIAPESGVTRDVISHELEWEDHSFMLADTAGMTFDKESDKPDLYRTVQVQTLASIDESDFLVLVVDVTVGLSPLDEMAYEMLVKSGKPFCVAINKVDNEALKSELAEFAKMSGWPSFPVSALHGRGFYNLLDHIVEQVGVPSEEKPREDMRVAIVGKPNVGKSSFFNRILKEDRVLVSDIPGTTRDAVDAQYRYKTNIMTLIDTAGMRKDKRVANQVEKYSMIRTEESIRRSDVALVLLDASLGLTAGDRRILRMVTDMKKGCIIAVNKWDLIEDETMRKFKEKLDNLVGAFHYIPIVFMSVKTGLNVRRCLDTVVKVFQNYMQKVSTPEINRLVRRCIEQTPPPLAKGKRLKVYYSAQTKIAPPQVEFFINSKKCLTESYMRHILNEMRDAWGFVGVPVTFSFREKTTKWRNGGPVDVAAQESLESKPKPRKKTVSETRKAREIEKRKASKPKPKKDDKGKKKGHRMSVRDSKKGTVKGTKRLTSKASKGNKVTPKRTSRKPAKGSARGPKGRR